MKDFLKKIYTTGIGLLLCSIAVVIVLAICGSIVNSSGSKVTKVFADMDTLYTELYKDAAVKPSRLNIGENKDGMVNARLSGYLYMPRGVSKDNPAPAVVITHGYLNSKEYMEPFAIELARRGYVVFAYDQYDHGTSTWDTPAAFNFFNWSAYDAITWMSQQEYVLKGTDGTAMVGATGHSMGGFSSEIGAMYDEVDVMSGKSQKLVAVLAMGADFRYSGSTPINMYKTRTAGALAAEYDEFFFDNSGSSSKTVTEKDYLSDKVGLQLLGLTDQVTTAENKTFYKVNPATNVAYNEDNPAPETGYGERIIYQVKGDHPYNTWSPEAVGDVVDFFNHAFQYQASIHGLTDYQASTKAGSKQVWVAKEVFTCISLIVLVFGIVAALTVTSDVPFLRYATTKESVQYFDGSYEGKPQSKAKKTIALLITVISTGFGFYFLTSLMDKTAASLTILNTYTRLALIVVAFALAVVGAVALINKVKEENGDAKKVIGRVAAGLGVEVVALFAFKWMINHGNTIIASGAKWFNAPSVNTIVYWAMAAGIMGLIFSVLSATVAGDSDIPLCDQFGLRANIKQIGVALIKAIGVCLAVFFFIWIIGIIFKTDFRVYTYAFKAEMAKIAWKSWLRYVPLFFVFYLTAGISIASATAGKGGWKADLIAIAIETLPSAIFLLYQYAILETTGTAPYSSFALNGILVQGLIPTLIILGFVQRRTLQKTGNIWTGVFFNTLFMTLITISNTTLYNLK